MLRAEVYAHAMRASQNRKKEVRTPVVCVLSTVYVMYCMQPSRLPSSLSTASPPDKTEWTDTRTSTQSRRIVRRKDASWSLNWPSEANLLARKQHMYFFGASVTTVCLFFLLLGEY